jgi:hypothetical protein
MLGHPVASDVATSQGDIVGNVVRPVLQSVERHDAIRIVKLPGQKVTMIVSRSVRSTSISRYTLSPLQ